MTIRKISYLLLAAALFLTAAACGGFANYYDETYDPPERRQYEEFRHARHENITRMRSPQRGPVTGRVAPQPADAPTRVIPHSTPRPQGQVTQIPGTYSRNDGPVHHGTYTGPGAQAIQAIPPEPVPANTAAPGTPAATPAATVPAGSAVAAGPASTGRELSSHKTQFNAKEEARKTNITRASSSINGHVVQPGKTFSYNQTVGPTIERRGYEESTIYVQGEKKKGFGGGVCQVSTTLSVAAEDAGMTIVERHDHSLPVSYAEEGDEAATSYGVLDFKFKNEKPFPVVIRSSVEGGTISVSICEG